MAGHEMLYLALTRPALTWGVPFEVLALNVMVTFAAGLELSVPTIWRSPGLFWAAAIPIHLGLRRLTSWDYHWFRTVRLWTVAAPWKVCRASRRDLERWRAVAKRLAALLGDKVLLEDHIADDVVPTRGNGVLAAFSADRVFPDTADDTDIAARFDRLHNALKNIAAADVELTVYQCRGEADPSGYQTGLHRAPSRASWTQPLAIASSAACCTRTGCSWRSRCTRRRQQRRASDGSWPRRVRILAAGKGRARRTLHATALGCLSRSVAVATRPIRSSGPTHWP
jgi:type IV secretory pathway VirB3-like protein